jgi:UrcA family protein
MSTMTSSSRVRNFVATAIFGVLASSLAAVCMAADSIDTPTVTVKFADLNVSSSQGAEELYKRIVAAADRVCRNLDGRDLAFQEHKNKCIREAIAAAVEKVNQGALFAIYNAKNRTRLPTTLVSQTH